MKNVENNDVLVESEMRGDRFEVREHLMHL
jgi:hypothetical protein